ncbi:MAG: DMT family transporter [Flavicella sp.]
MQHKKWLFLSILALTWGSSFILIKKALIGLNPIEIGAFRILIAGFILLLIGGPKLLKIKRHFWKPLLIVAFAGTFIPVFLFSFAVREIDSAVAAVLNSLTPLLTLILGALFFKFSFSKKQIFGTLLGLAGTLALLLNSALENPTKNYGYAFLVLIAASGYAFSVNFIKTKLPKLDTVSITTATFTVLIPPTLMVLCFSGFFDKAISDPLVLSSLGYVTILAALGTSMAMLLFNKLIQISSPVFSASVSYLITVVAVIWGIIDGEKLTFIQLAAAALVIYGVIKAQRKTSN